MPPRIHPPLALGLAFVPGYTHHVRGEDVMLWTAPVASPAFLLALKREPLRMRRAGYLHFHIGDLGMRPVWWPARCVSSPAELASLQADLDRLVAEDAASAQDDAERRAGRVAEVAAADRAAAEAALPRLAAIAERTPWQLGRALAEAAALVKDGITDSFSAGRALALIRNADGVRSRAEVALRKLPPEGWLRLAESADVRAAALEGCRLLSALDEDRASRRNDAGWGQDDSGVGHLLAERSELSREETAHAARLLHHHRKQLPGDLRSRLFGSAVAPASAPAL
ncbi:hypothetical protein [Methylorubrum sp. DB1722]|uniref:hypothetical protein n=1 Tax=Methylorubrum sp. DB1722 TaxID=2478916 RepID=UPI0018E2B5DD|nr:hypothetical protein [Methylorubrum sp. DB1722]MBI1689545.1 hypothetical protein [Methylorubrum sp. DB1722]